HYNKLFEDKSGKTPLQKTLHWVQLRPAPPSQRGNQQVWQVQVQRRSQSVPQIWLVGRRHHGGARRREIRCLLPELQGEERVWREVEDVVVSESRKLVRWYPNQSYQLFILDE
ncbi:hypothetical protein LINPERHAP1_LOCUS30269, partial [Linum perenne]